MANEITVVETDDAMLWHHIFTSIMGIQDTSNQIRASITSITAGRAPQPDEFRPPEPYSYGDGNGNGSEDGESALERFAEELKLEPITVQATCNPTTEPPYMHLDVRAWEDFRRNIPSRGNTSIPPIVLAATLLVLWFRNIRSGTATVSQAQAILNTIDTRDRNPARGLKNCGWLQTRDDVIKLNPARFTQASNVARAYCSQRPIEE